MSWHNSDPRDKYDDDSGKAIVIGLGDGQYSGAVIETHEGWMVRTDRDDVADVYADTAWPDHWYGVLAERRKHEDE